MLRQIARELDPAAIEGRLDVILPNDQSAGISRRTALVGHRRQEHEPCLAGGPGRDVAERIVSWLDRMVLSQSDVLMDLAGGNAMDLIAMSMCHYTEDLLTTRSRIRAGSGRLQRAPQRRIASASTRSTASGTAHEHRRRERNRGWPSWAESLRASAMRGSATRSPSSTCWRHRLRWHACGRRRASRANGVTRPEMVAERVGMFVPSHGLWDEVVAGYPLAGSFPSTRPFDPDTLRFPASRLDHQGEDEQVLRPGRRALLDRGQSQSGKETLHY